MGGRLRRLSLAQRILFYLQAHPPLLALFLVAQLCSSCILAGERCGPNQVLKEGDDYSLCVCEPGRIVSKDGSRCVSCGANEVARDDACVCDSGFARASADGACVRVDLGATCAGPEDCLAADSLCVTSEREGEAGYCSSTACSSNAECPADWSCESANDTRYCRKPPTGLGMHCDSEADCAGFEANYCEGIQSHTCVLFGCAAKVVTCQNEWLCCDYTELFGSEFSLCVGPSVLQSGSCPNGGSRVEL